VKAPIVKKQPSLRPRQRYKLADFITRDQFIESGRGGRQFDTVDKLEWFIRLHRPELIARGEYIRGRGARPSLIGPGFDALAVDILRRQGAAA
jgi:hypothetical protein